MTAAVIVAAYTSVQGDGGNGGNGVTTDLNPTTGDYLLVCQCVSANADAMTKPDATWTEVALPDNSIATGGGSIRAWWKKNPAASTTYTWAASSGRRSIMGFLIRGADGTTFVDVASSLQAVPGANHAPPAVSTTGPDRLIVDFAGLRQFSPDVANWTPPAGITEVADIQGADGNNNIRLAGGQGVKATAGAVATTPWTQSDVNEESIVVRIAIVPAVTGGADVTLTDSSGGSQASGSLDSASIGVVKTDQSGGSSAAGSADAAAIGVTKQDASGGSSAAGALDALAVGVIRTDTSGGTGAAGSDGATSVGVVKTDASGGTGAAGSSETLITDQIRTDASGGSAGAGSADTLARGVVLVDASGGTSAAGSLDQATQGLFLTDTSGGSSGGGTATGATVGVSIPDTSGGTAGAGSPTPVAATVITDTSGGSSSAGAGGLVMTGTPVTIGDTSGGGSAGGSTDSIASSSVKRDTMVMPILQEALACLRTEASLTENPPQHYHVRPGASFEPSADGYGRDECCDGIGWVRLVANYEGGDANWLEPAGGVEGNCAPIAWAVIIEIGLMRCVPVAADRGGGNVTSEQWTAAAQAQLDDGAALRRVLCCLREIRGVSDVVSGQLSPLENSGGCGGITLQVTIRADACDC